MELNFRESCLTLLAIAAIMVLGLFVIEMPISVILLAEVLLVGVIALVRKIPYNELQKDMIASVNSFLTPILMLLLIGALVASWIIGGTVPTLIYIGLKIIDARFFLLITFLMCSLLSMLIGTSWGVMSTLGVAFMGISGGLGVEPAYTVSAVVSGAFLGDKLSPLSSSLVLATELTSANPTDGIKSASTSNVPAFVASLVLYTVLGFKTAPQADAPVEGTQAVLDALSADFNIGFLPLIAPILLIVFIAVKIPSIPTFMLCTVVGVLESLFVQGESLHDVSEGLVNGYTLGSSQLVNDMLQYGGINSMASTLILLMFAACFGGIIKRLGIITCLLESVFRRANSTGKVVTAAVLLHTICFVVTGNYYTVNSILAPALNDIYDRNGLSRAKLSAVLLNAGTGISPIIPWTATAIFISGTLGYEGVGYCIYAPILWLPVLLMPIFAFFGRGKKKEAAAKA